MSKLFFSIAIICLFISSCITSTKKNEVTTNIDSTQVKKTALNNIISPSENDTVRVNIVNGTASLQIHKEERKYVNLAFNSADYTKMTGTLSSKDSLANIRFNNIVLPNGEMDGPFGREITYDLPVKGDYILSIHESLMAGDPWAGDFEVTISLSK